MHNIYHSTGKTVRVFTDKMMIPIAASVWVSVGEGTVPGR